MQAKKNRMAPINAFYLVFTGSSSMLLIMYRGLNKNGFDNSLVLSVLLSIPLILVASFPAIISVRKRKNPLDVKWISKIYSLYYFINAGISAYLFSLFCGEIFNFYSKSIIFSLIIIVCAAYCAYLGIEGMSRFAGFAFALFIIGVIFLFALNLKQIEYLKLFPISFEGSKVIKNTLLICAAYSDISLMFVLDKRVNGDAEMPFVLGVLCSMVLTFLLGMLIIFVEGEGQIFQKYPLYALFQTAEMGGSERLDAVFTVLYIFGIFIRIMLYIYCAAFCLNMKSKGKSAVLCAAVSIAFSAVGKMLLSAKYINTICIILFLIFIILIPILTLIFKKRNYGDELIESI